MRPPTRRISAAFCVAVANCVDNRPAVYFYADVDEEEYDEDAAPGDEEEEGEEDEEENEEEEEEDLSGEVG